MTRISRYFLQAYLKPFLFSFSALALLIMVSEMLERLDKFIAGHAPASVIIQYILSILPTRSIEIFPMAALLAVLFSLGQLSRNQEITACMSGGVHPWKCAQPLLLTGLFMAGFCWALGEYVVPPASRHAKRLWEMDIRHITFNHQTRFTNLTAAGENGIFYSMSLLDTAEGRMENLLVDQLKDGKPWRQTQAKSAQWTGDGWTLRTGVQRAFTDDGLGMADQRPFTEEKMPFREAPSDLTPQDPDPDRMSSRQLREHVRRLKILGIPTRKQEVELHMKWALPWANFIVLLLGIPFAFQKRGGKVKAVGLALGVAFFYFGLMQVGRALGQKPWCPPLVGAWLANLVFLSMGSGLFLRMRKLA